MRGFTLIEAMIVIVIGAILVVAAIPVTTTLQTSAQLNESASQLSQTLRIARQRSIDRVNNSAHGVHIIQSAESDSTVLYQGSSYAARDPQEDQATELATSIELTTTFPGNDVNFSVGVGIPTSAGTITLTHATRGTRTIAINAAGTIEQQ